MFFTPLDLERALVQQVGIWTADMLLKSPIDRGAVPIGLQIFQGHIPSFQAGPKVPNQWKAPALAIKCSGGLYRREEGEATANFAILVWDDNLDRVGYQDVHNIMNRITNGLLETVVVGNPPSFVLLDAPIHFDLIEDPSVDFFPYFLGAVTAHFGIMSPGPDAAPYNDLAGSSLIGPTFTETP